jgi:L-asparagine transporter-like permease
MGFFKRQKQAEIAVDERNDKILDAEVVEPETHEEKQKLSKVELASFVITIISTFYTLATVLTFILENWVPNAFSTALKVLLVAWVVAFVVIIGFSIATRDTKKTKKYLGTYKKLIKLFKGFVNLMFLVITAVSMVGIVKEGIDGIMQMAVMAVTVLVAATQLAVNVAKFMVKTMRKKRKAKKKAQKEEKRLARK